MKIGRGNFIALVIFTALAFVWPAFPAHAAEPEGDFDDLARTFAVTVQRDPRQSWTGYGIYLGEGLVLTAAHVVAGSLPNLQVDIAGKSLPAKIVKEGDFETVDLTLLAIDARLLPPSLGLRLMPICAKPPRLGQDVVVVTPEASTHSSIMSPMLLPAEIRARFDTVIPDVQTTGNSGSGVFDTANECLLGIMSRKIQVKPKTAGHGGEMRDLAKYFVPAWVIQPFVQPLLAPVRGEALTAAPH